MKSGSLWVLLAGVVFGLALGAAWSPRGGGGGSGEPVDRESGRGGGSRALTGSPGSGEPGKLPRDRATRTHRPEAGPRIGELSAEILVGALGSLRNEKDMNVMQLARFGGMIARMSEGETLALLQGLIKVPEGEDRNRTEMRTVLTGIVFTRLCEVNGPEAMRMAAAGELGEKFAKDSDELLAIGMNSWVAADPEGAKRWFDGVLGEVDQLAVDGGMEEDMKNATGVMSLLKEEDLMDAYLRGMAKHDAEGLAKSVEGLRHEEVREGMEGKIFEAVVDAETTADGLVKVLAQYEDAESTNARIEAIGKLSALDNERAAEWVEGRGRSTERDHLITKVAGDMMKKDPAAGAEWYMAQEIVSEDQERNRMQRITWEWGNADYEATSTWLESQPDGPARDGAESSIAQLAASRKEWTDSMAWLRDIADEKMRANALDRVFRAGWNRTDKVMNAGLLEAAESAGFGEEARKYGGKK